MAVELPEPLQWVLLLLAGARWPEADEDQLREMADHWRKAGQSLQDAGHAADAAIKGALEGQQGAAADALTKHWAQYTTGKGSKDDPGFFPGLVDACNGMGDMLEAMANSAETAKIQIVTQLGILAFDIATAEAEAPETFGASMAQVPIVIGAIREAVGQILKRLLREAVEHAIKQAAQMAAINLMAQTIELMQGHRKSIDMKEVGQNALGGAVSGATGHLLGKGVGTAGSKLGLGGAMESLPGKLATGAAVGVGTDATTQAITTGHVDGSSLLGSGLSGAGGVGSHAAAAVAKGHFSGPDIASIPHEGQLPTFSGTTHADSLSNSYRGLGDSGGAGPSAGSTSRPSLTPFTPHSSTDSFAPGRSVSGPNGADVHGLGNSSRPDHAAAPANPVGPRSSTVTDSAPPSRSATEPTATPQFDSAAAAHAARPSTVSFAPGRSVSGPNGADVHGLGNSSASDHAAAPANPVGPRHTVVEPLEAMPAPDHTAGPTPAPVHGGGNALQGDSGDPLFVGGRMAGTGGAFGHTEPSYPAVDSWPAPDAPPAPASHGLGTVAPGPSPVAPEAIRSEAPSKPTTPDIRLDDAAVPTESSPTVTVPAEQTPAAAPAPDFGSVPVPPPLPTPSATGAAQTTHGVPFRPDTSTPPHGSTPTAGHPGAPTHSTTPIPTTGGSGIGNSRPQSSGTRTGHTPSPEQINRQQELDQLRRDNAGKVKDTVHGLGKEQRYVAAPPHDGERLVRDLPGMSEADRLRELDSLSGDNRRWLARDPQFVDALRNSLPPKEFAKTAAHLLVDLDHRVTAAPSARQEARAQVERMLQDPETTANLLKNGASVMVVPKDVSMTDVNAFHGLAGVHTHSSAGGGRGWDDVRGSGGKQAAVTEENLTGDYTTIGNGTHYEGGYSTTTHEFAHTVHDFGLSPADRQLIEQAYHSKLNDPAAVWPDGTHPDNYSRRDDHEYFAQVTNAWLGTNHGEDPYSGEWRNNGPAWVRAHEPALVPLLEKLYGAHPAAIHSEPANQVRANTGQYEDFSEFWKGIDEQHGVSHPPAPPVHAPGGAPAAHHVGDGQPAQPAEGHPATGHQPSPPPVPPHSSARPLPEERQRRSFLTTVERHLDDGYAIMARSGDGARFRITRASDGSGYVAKAEGVGGQRTTITQQQLAGYSYLGTVTTGGGKAAVIAPVAFQAQERPAADQLKHESDQVMLFDQNRNSFAHYSFDLVAGKGRGANLRQNDHLTIENSLGALFLQLKNDPSRVNEFMGNRPYQIKPEFNRMLVGSGHGEIDNFNFRPEQQGRRPLGADGMYDNLRNTTNNRRPNTETVPNLPVERQISLTQFVAYSRVSLQRLGMHGNSSAEFGQSIEGMAAKMGYNPDDLYLNADQKSDFTKFVALTAQFTGAREVPEHLIQLTSHHPRIELNAQQFDELAAHLPEGELKNRIRQAVSPQGGGRWVVNQNGPDMNGIRTAIVQKYWPEIVHWTQNP